MYKILPNFQFSLELKLFFGTIALKKKKDGVSPFMFEVYAFLHVLSLTLLHLRTGYGFHIHFNGEAPLLMLESLLL